MSQVSAVEHEQARDRSFFPVRGSRTEFTMQGQGRPFLFLHPGLGLFGSDALLARLSERGQVLAPSHPGFGGSELPRTFSNVDDLAYFYLDVMDELDLKDVALIGASFGGWIAAQIAVKSSERLSGLVLIDTVGIKIGPRESRDIADIHALPQDEVIKRSFHDASIGRRDHAKLSDEEALTEARNREAFALFGWSPYMHDPKLRGRLHRIKVPTLVLWGQSDRIVTPDYGRTFAAEIPDSRFEIIEAAGHYPYIERPDAVADRILDFLKNIAPLARRANSGS